MSDKAGNLEAVSISFSYAQSAAVLHDVSLKVAPSRVTVLGGPNGCGKSTLLKILARQLPPTEGQVRLDNTDTKEMKPEDFARRVAFVAQSSAANCHLSVEELVMLGRNPHQRWWSWQVSKADREAVQNALERTALTALKSRSLATLSGGELKRAMIATALAQETDYILLDEPVAHLDFKHQVSLLSLIRELKTKNLGILIVLHDLNMIEHVADDLILLKKNKSGPSHIGFAGSLETVLTPETIREIFEVDTAILKDETGKRFFSIKNW